MKKKVDKYRYMTLDQDSNIWEDLGRYKSLSLPCMSSVNARERGEYDDDVMTYIGNSSDKSQVVMKNLMLLIPNDPPVTHKSDRKTNDKV